MDKYKGKINAIQFKDEKSFNKIIELLKFDMSYTMACEVGIRVKHQPSLTERTRLFKGDYLCEYSHGKYMILSEEFMSNFKKG